MRVRGEVEDGGLRGREKERRRGAGNMRVRMRRERKLAEVLACTAGRLPRTRRGGAVGVRQ